jgi:hypothetical protein
MKPIVPCTLLALLMTAAAARADDDALRRCRAIAEAPARLACYDAIVPARAAAAPAAASAAAPNAASRFGLSAPADAVERVESRIEGRFEGWNPRGLFRLANGQVWQVADDSRGVYWLESPKVVVRRGALGSYLLEIEGTTAMVRVRRVE